MPVRVLVAGHDALDGSLRPYSSAVDQAGGQGIRAWLHDLEADDLVAVASFLTSFDGLLLPGGKDLRPELYGETDHPKLGQTDPPLDSGQLALARAAARLQFPTLAICRGIQVVGVALGATLYQDLPDQRPSDVAHRAPAGASEARHPVTLATGSRLRALLGADEIVVNSSHHQALRESAAGSAGQLTLAATAADGVIEAVEHPGWRSLIAVQWHPERLVASDPLARAIFAEFVRACGGGR